jgi:hypothetical protein
MKYMREELLPYFFSFSRVKAPWKFLNFTNSIKSCIVNPSQFNNL